METMETMELIKTIRAAIAEGGADAVLSIPNLKELYDQDGDVQIVWYDRDDLLAAGCGIDADQFVRLVCDYTPPGFFTTSKNNEQMNVALEAGFGDLFGGDRVLVCLQSDVEHALLSLNKLSIDVDSESESDDEPDIGITVSYGNKGCGPRVDIEVRNGFGFVGPWCVFDGTESVEGGISFDHLPDDLPVPVKELLKRSIESGIDMWFRALPEAERLEHE